MTHMLVSAGLTTRRGMSRKQIGLAWFAGLFPDLSVIAMVMWARLSDYSGPMWNKPEGLYWLQPWQFYSAVSNSIPLYLVVLIMGILLFRSLGDEEQTTAETVRPRVRSNRALAQTLMIFGGGALAHVVFDFPVHTDDAHIHFWPFTEWRFHSGISYYQSSHYGDVVGFLELLIALTMIWILTRRFRSWWVTGFATLLVLPHLLQFVPREWQVSIFRYLF